MSQLPYQDFESFRALCQERRVARTLVTGRPLWIRRRPIRPRRLLDPAPRGVRRTGVHRINAARTVLGLPVLAWSVLNEPVAQLVVGIFNRGMPLDELQQLGTSAGFSDI